MMKGSTSKKVIKICNKCEKEHQSTNLLYCQSCYNYIWLKSKSDNSPLIPCECNCGELIHSINRQGKPARFKRGHSARVMNRDYMQGERHPNYKGGSYIDPQGYRRLWKPSHPNSDTRGYIHEHRFVMSEYLGRPLLTNEEIHHRDKNRLNNEISNLELLLKADHTSHHMKGHKYGIEDLSGRTCKLCGSDKTFIKKYNNRPMWLKYGNDFICNKCYHKEDYKKKKGLGLL